MSINKWGMFYLFYNFNDYRSPHGRSWLKESSMDSLSQLSECMSECEDRAVNKNHTLHLSRYMKLRLDLKSSKQFIAIIIGDPVWILLQPSLVSLFGSSPKFVCGTFCSITWRTSATLINDISFRLSADM